MIPFSVLMSVYEKESPSNLYDSIVSVLNQSYPASEVVIVCDGPLTSALNDVLIKFQKENSNIKLLRLEQNHGLWYALNEGISICANEVIARMDSDDVCNYKRFEKQIPYMEQGYDLVGSNVIEFEETRILSERCVPETKKEIIKFCKYRNPYNHPSVVYRKSIVQEVGGYKSLYRLDDYTLWVDLLRLEKLKTINLQENLVYMRTSEKSYERRSGKELFKSLFHLRCYMLKKHDIGLVTFVNSLVFQTILLLCTPKIKSTIYKIFLRKRIT